MTEWKDARQLVPNLSEEVYAMAEYFDRNIPNLKDIDSNGLALNLILAHIDIERGESLYRGATLPSVVLRNRALALQQLPYVLQLVDAFYPQDYANDVRQVCKEAYGWDVPVYVTTLA